MATIPTISAGLTTTGATSSSQSADSSGALGKNAFLKLLVTKLQHQDPTKPMEDGEFLAELAQFSSLETLQEISQSLNDITQLLVEQRYSTTATTGSTTAATSSTTA